LQLDAVTATIHAQADLTPGKNSLYLLDRKLWRCKRK